MRLTLHGSLALLLAFGAGCRRAETPSYLAAAPEPYRNLTHPVTIDLPDSGGILVNGYAVARDSISFVFQAIRTLPPERQVMFFDTIGTDRRRDAAWIDSVGQALGVRLYNAHATWPDAGPPPGFRVVRPHEDLPP
jgi:hypothetical protein